jgi:outer membrane receptor protein involved in Fe transport
LTVAIAAAINLAGSLSPSSHAQEPASEADDDLALEEVVVTGTRIASDDGFGRTSPVTVVGMEQIESLGFTRVEDILNTLPQVEADQNTFLSNGSSGTATVDLRGLGANRTLVLINGRRLQPGGVYTESADVNQIPASMIERVEVLTGGASATYGADAVAGVVNFILRRVDGLEVSTGISGYQHDNDNGYMQDLMDAQGYDYPTGSTGLDGKAYFVNLVVGGEFAGGRGNGTLYFNWRENDSLLQATRDYSGCALNAQGTFCTGSATADIPNFFIAPLTAEGEGPYGYDYLQEEFVTLQPDSSLALFEDNFFNFNPINYFMRPDERWSYGAFADFEINPHAVAYLEAMGASDRTDAQIANSGTFFAEAYPLLLDNAYFPENFRDSLRSLFPGEEDFGLYIGKRNVEGGPRRDLLEHASFRIVTGVRGEIAGEWSYDVSYLHAQTSSSSTYVNDMYAPSVAVAVDSRLCEPDPDCIPYQVFTYQGVTPEAAGGLTATALTGADTATDIIQAYATGDLGWGLPAGEILVATGYEYRRVEYERISDTTYQEGLLLGQGGRVPDLAGTYSVDELFIEANVPLLSGAAFARNLTMDLAYRWSDYSSSGQSGTYRAGLDWQSLDWLRLRTGYNHAARTPNVSELSDPQQRGDWPFIDPCLGSEPLYTFEQCARTGMSAAQYGNTPALEFAFGVNTIVGGNPALEPEEADTVTAGLVFDVWTGMQLSLDYWDIRIDGVIDTIPPPQAFDQCALFGQLCELIHRNAGGNLWQGTDGYIVNVLLNLGEQHSSGVDVAWNWALDANWSFDLIGSFYLTREVMLVPGEASSRFDCAGLVSETCDPTPEWRHLASATYDSNGFWAVSGRWRYYSAVDYTGTINLLAEDTLTAFNYFDLNATLRFMENHRVVIGINNVLDEEPPLVGASLATNANTIAGYYDTLGRFLFANLTLAF